MNWSGQHNRTGDELAAQLALHPTRTAGVAASRGYTSARRGSCVNRTAVRRRMPIIEIYASGQLIGHASLDGVDDGMGVAFGPFHPSARYAEIRPSVTAAAEARHQRKPAIKLDLEARTTTGEVISTGFVQIDDFADVDVDPEATVQFSDRDQWLRVSGAV